MLFCKIFSGTIITAHKWLSFYRALNALFERASKHIKCIVSLRLDEYSVPILDKSKSCKDNHL